MGLGTRTRGRLLLALAALTLGAVESRAQSCGEVGGDYCSQSGVCPQGHTSLGQTYDCNPCCQEVSQGPSCGALGGNWCSQSGGCPSGYDSLGGTYDCNPCCRQRNQGQMSFSVYTVGSVSGGVVYASSSVVDNSWGCAHSGYSTSTKITSPCGRTAIGQSSGLQASTQLGVNAEFGGYTIATIGSYYCSCAMAWAGFGGGQTIDVRQPYFLHTYADYLLPPGPEAGGGRGSKLYWRVRNYQVQDTNYQPINRVMSVQEFFNPFLNLCGDVQLEEGGGLTQPAGTYRDNLYLDTPRCRPGGNYQCFISRDQLFTVEGVSVNPAFHQEYFCDRVEIFPTILP